MSSNPYPTTLADLDLNRTNDSPSLYKTIRSLRMATLSIPNRLRSIVADAEYVQSVATKHGFPLIANERCGSWYIPPQVKAGSTYFKSTDGHHGQWDFSLRRLNLQLLDVLGECGGAVVVDSTRRGKGMPDALRRTVPIWVAVLNRTCFPERVGRWGGLQVRKGLDGLGESEVSQIERRIEGWVGAFRSLGVDVEDLRGRLKRPVRIVWEVNGLELGEDDDDVEWDLLEDVGLDGDDEKHNVLVLCSASKRVPGAEISEGGYIQGAGDDSEGWSHGLTPQLFWANRDLLLATPEDDLSVLIEMLMKDAEDQGIVGKPLLIRPTKSIYIGVSSYECEDFDLVVNCNRESSSTSRKVLGLACRTGKLGSRDLRDKLVLVRGFVASTFKRLAGFRVLVTCDTGKDLAVGVVVMLLCLFYDDTGSVADTVPTKQIDKMLVKQRLAWISNSKPDVNPSRSTLQAVNSFLMGRPD